MSVLEYLKNQWFKLETYQDLKRLMMDFSGNEKKEFLRCILKWGSSKQNQTRQEYWGVSSALEQCGAEEEKRAVMKQTFGLAVTEKLAEHHPKHDDRIRFLEKGIEAGRILCKKRSVYSLEFISTSGWFLYILGGILLYLNTMQQIGLLDDVKNAVVGRWSWTKYDPFIFGMFLAPAVCYLIWSLYVSHKAKRIIYGV